MSAPTGDLSALVSARLCHDLVSPLGAIGNGLELMQMSAGGRGQAELALIADSLENALGKLRFLRVAFGPADPLARQSLEEAEEISRAAFQGRFAVRWLPLARDMPRPLAKALYLTILCLEKSLPLGGEVAVRADEATAALQVKARRIAPPDALWAHATGGAPLPPCGSDAVQFALLCRCLAEHAGRLEARFEETEASLTLEMPELRR